MICTKEYVLLSKLQINTLEFNIFDSISRAQDAILKDLQTDITKEFDFIVAENHFEIIPGKTEGVYAWIAVNYALDRFSHSSNLGRC